VNFVPLRRIAEINPPCPQFDQLPRDAKVSFLPLEKVWSDSRADQSRRRTKNEVMTGYTRFQPGDVVCPKVTPTFQAGRSMIASGMGAGTTELHVLRARPGFDPRWICYAVRSNHFLAEGVTAFEGVAGLQRVPPEFLQEFRVVELEAEEQRRIADFLDDRVARIDQIITARRRQITFEQELQASAYSEILESASKSQRVEIRRVLAKAPDYGLLPSAVSDDPTLPRYIRTTDISENGTIRSDTFASVDHSYLRDYSVKAGDVLIARSGNTIGKGLVFEGEAEAVFAGYLVRLQFASIDPWVYWFFTKTSDFTGQLWANAVQSTIPNFNADRYSGMTMPDVRPAQVAALKTLREQRDSSTQRMDALAQSTALLAEYKQALITAAVTGELDVTTAGSGIPG